MNVGRWPRGQRMFASTACSAFCLLIVGRPIDLIRADHPSHSMTVNLGPGNEDFEKKLKDYHGFSNASQAFERARGFDLSGRDLRRAELHLEEFALHEVNFSGSDLTGASIEETNFRNCSFRNAILRGVLSAGGIHETCDLTNADISHSYLGLTTKQLRSTRNYQEKDLSDTILQGDFKGVSFVGFNLRGTVFHLCDLAGCDFTGTDILGGALICRRKPVEGIGGEWYPFAKEQLCSTKSYKERNLDQVVFVGCDFRGADFSRQNLGHFVWCDLTNTDLTNADFPQAFAGSYSLPTSRKTAGITFYAMRSAYGLSECTLTAQQFYATRAYKSKRLPPGFTLERMNLDGWDFSGMDLRAVWFRFSSLKGANLTDARGGDFNYTRGLTLDQVKSTRSYKDKRLDEMVLPKEIAEALKQK